MGDKTAGDEMHGFGKQHPAVVCPVSITSRLHVLSLQVLQSRCSFIFQLYFKTVSPSPLTRPLSALLCVCVCVCGDWQVSPRR